MKFTISSIALITMVIVSISLHVIAHTTEPHRPLPRRAQRLDVFPILNMYINTLDLINSGDYESAISNIHSIDELILPEDISVLRDHVDNVLLRICYHIRELNKTTTNFSRIYPINRIPDLLKSLDELERSWFSLTGALRRYTPVEYHTKLKSIEDLGYKYIRFIERMVKYSILESIYLAYENKLYSKIADIEIDTNISNGILYPSSIAELNISIKLRNYTYPLTAVLIALNKENRLFREILTHPIIKSEEFIRTTFQIPMDFYIESRGKEFKYINIFLILISRNNYQIKTISFNTSYKLTATYMIVPRIVYKGIGSIVKIYYSPENISRKARILLDGKVIDTIILRGTPYEYTLNIKYNVSIGYHLLEIYIEPYKEYSPATYSSNIIVTYIPYEYNIYISDIELYPFTRISITCETTNLTRYSKPNTLIIVAGDRKFIRSVNTERYVETIDLGLFFLLEVDKVNITLIPGNTTYSPVTAEFIVYRINVVTIIFLIVYPLIGRTVMRRIKLW